MASDGRVSEAKELEVIELIRELAPIYAMVENKMGSKSGKGLFYPAKNNVAVLQAGEEYLLSNACYVS